MIKNYLKVATRTLKRHKAFSFINISGLAIGMASCLLLLLYIQDELSYDRYNDNYHRIYRIATMAQMGDTTVNVVGAAAPMAKTLVDEFPDVEDAVRFQDGDDIRVSFGEKSFREKRVTYTDSSFFNIFTVPLLAGDAETALGSPRTLVLSEHTQKNILATLIRLGRHCCLTAKPITKLQESSRKSRKTPIFTSISWLLSLLSRKVKCRCGSVSISKPTCS